ncbi:MAG: polysaccharide biosynthesis C-terminal domain-containing protein [Bacteroidota bacterium]
MGIVLNQTYKNTLIIFLGFAIGGINVLFLYTHFLQEDYYGLITFLLSTANILMPLLVFGMQHTVVKFFSSYEDRIHRDNFLITTIFLPLLIIIPLALFGAFIYDKIAGILSQENEIIKKYTYLIFLIAVFMGYFEVFYAWSRVQLKSVFGNFVREVFARVSVSVLLIMVFFKWITNEEFIYAITIVYFLRLLIIVLYALLLYTPKTKHYQLPDNIKEILSFSFYIILAGSAGTILLEIDKFMIPQLEQIAKVAYYAVGVYIASVIAIPNRAMQQIINPITAKEINNNNLPEVEKLYKQSSINLLIAGGLLFLLINLNVTELYELINKPEYAIGIPVVMIISFSELIKLATGTNGAILTNSKYYKIFFYFSIAMALSVIVLNRYLIELMGIEGAALATLIVVFVFSLIKIAYVQKKLNMQPFSTKTLVILAIILVLFLIFFKIDFTDNSILNIIIKSVLISLIYITMILKFKISEDLNQMIKKYVDGKK